MIDRILEHIGEPTHAPKVLPVCGPPQGELGFTQDVTVDDWPEMDQTAGQIDDGWD